jgi:hypothetical protein
MDVWRGMPDLLRAAKVYLDTLDKALLYEIDAGGQLGKVVVRVNCNDKGQIDGVRACITSNFIPIGGGLNPSTWPRHAMCGWGVSGAGFEPDHAWLLSPTTIPIGNNRSSLNCRPAP